MYKTIGYSLSKEKEIILSNMAKEKGVTLHEFMRKSLLSYIENNQLSEKALIVQGLNIIESHLRENGGMSKTEWEVIEKQAAKKLEQYKSLQGYKE